MKAITEEDKNLKLDNEIEIIITETLKRAKNKIDSIILYGSYGRGEGAFFRDYKNNIRTYNDFDLVLVVNQLIDNSTINDIAVELNKRLDVKWIDISQKTRKKLKKLKLTIFNFDLKHGSRVIYGDKMILDSLPNYDSSKIGLKEAETLYFTRVWTFLGGLPYDGFDRELNKEESRFFRNQMSKAILAVVDVLLIKEKSYDSSYRKRVQNVGYLYKENLELLRWTQWAIAEKCYPKDDVLPIVKLREMYAEIASIFIKEMYSVLEIYYGQKISGPQDIEKALKYSFSEKIALLKSIVKTRSFKYIQQTKMRIAQSYLLDSFLKEGAEKEHAINKSKTLIEEINGCKKDEVLGWNTLRVLISELRMKI